MRLNNYLVEKESLFDKDPEYIAKEGKQPNTYIVSKWTRGKTPRDVYHIQGSGNNWKCSCPTGRKGGCKHVKFVKEWIKNGKPNPYDISSDDVKNFFKMYENGEK
jgi:hypothetical protein